MGVDDLVRTLYERYQARDWDAASLVLHDQARLDMPSTRERLDGRQEIIGFQRDYPEPWGELRVLRTVSDRHTAVAEVEVTAPGAVFRCAAFWVAEGGLLREGVEYWVTVGGEEPPPSRRSARDVTVAEAPGAPHP